MKPTALWNLIELPRAALRGENRVWVVDQEDRLRFREVEVLRATRKQILVRAGLEAGERVCLSLLEVVSDGMKVRILGAEESTRLATDEGAQRSAS